MGSSRSTHPQTGTGPEQQQWQRLGGVTHTRGLFQGRCTWAEGESENVDEKDEDEGSGEESETSDKSEKSEASDEPDEHDEPEPEVGPPLLTPVSQDAGVALNLPDKLAMASHGHRICPFQWAKFAGHHRYWLAECHL